MIQLKHWDERTTPDLRSTAIAQKINAACADIPQATVIAMTPGKRHLAGCYMWNYGESKPLTPEQERATALFRERVRRHIPAESDMEYLEQPFAFAEKYQARPFSGGAEKFELNFIHSYAASCGDIFIDIENHDPIPENLLAQYASMGIRGIWMHAILYLLHPLARRFTEKASLKVQRTAAAICFKLKTFAHRS